MYRQNKLKEELDNLRIENYRLRNEITFWKERCNTFYSEITSLRFQLQNRDLMGRLITKETLEPKIIKLDKEVEDNDYKPEKELTQEDSELLNRLVESENY